MAQTMIGDLVARALAEDVGDGDVTTAATVPADARARATITQKAPGVVFGLDARGADVSLARSRGGDRAPGRRGRVARRGPGAAGRGLGRAILTARADRAELPAAPVRRGHADAPAASRPWPGTGVDDPRHAQDDARSTDAREGRGGGRWGDQPPGRAVRRDPDQGEPLGARRRRRGCRSSRARELAPELRARGRVRARWRRSTRRSRRAPADPARQHGHRAAARRPCARGRPRRARGQRWRHARDARGNREHRRTIHLSRRADPQRTGTRSLPHPRAICHEPTDARCHGRTPDAREHPRAAG